MVNKSDLCDEFPCNPEGDCTTCSATWTGFPVDPRKPAETYEPTLVEREHIARALDESAEQYQKEHAHDKI